MVIPVDPTDALPVGMDCPPRLLASEFSSACPRDEREAAWDQPPGKPAFVA